MGKETSIQWCDSSVNPVMGCAGCELARSEAEDNRCYAWVQTAVKSQSGNPGWPKDFFIPVLFENRMAAASRWTDLRGIRRPDKPWLGVASRLIFISDMGDALSETECIMPDGTHVTGVPFEFLEQQIIDTVNSDFGRRHIWLWLTKRPHRLARFARFLSRPWPKNLWVGTSVTSRTTLPRCYELEDVGDDSTLRFVSVEPLWEDVSLATRLARGRIGWVIVGGESKQRRGPARAFNLSWARALRDDCSAHGVPFFLKQLGGTVIDGAKPLVEPPRVSTEDKRDRAHRGVWTFWPQDLRIREVPVAA